MNNAEKRYIAWLLIGAAILIGLYMAIKITVGKKPPPPSGNQLAYLSYNNELTNYLVSIKSHLRDGDWFHLSSGNFGATPNVSHLNLWASQIKPILPNAVFVAHTGGMANVQTIITGGLSSDFSYIALDWEPDEPGFDKTQSGTENILTQFNTYCHQHGYKSIGYMSGQGINGDNAVDKWDYSAFGKICDHITVQTQGLEGVAGGKGPQVVDYLTNQFTSAGLSPINLTCQATVGSVSSGIVVTNQEVLDTYNETIKDGQNLFFLEFAGSTGPDLVTFLQSIGR